MKNDPGQLRLDLMAVRYLEASEHGNLDTIAEIWAAAAADPELELLLHGLNEELTIAPRSRHWRSWSGLAAAAVAACVAAFIWTFALRHGANDQRANSNFAPAPVVVQSSTDGSPTAPVSNLSRFALLNADLQGEEMPSFAWPFHGSQVMRGNSTIPADLLN
jgi:hypothetical protein